MEYLFEARDIVKTYGDYTALQNVSIRVPRGSIFGLLGPNGAGKTSLIRIINQITGPDSGELFFNGTPLSSAHIYRIGYLPEERGLYKKMAVGEQALYLAQLKGLSKTEARERLKHWFAKLDITHWWNKKVEELSKGMAQKVQFIVTVLHEPELLIFDEPFSGFDPVNAQLIKEEILELNRKGATIIFSTHRMESVEELCDHIALINKSRVILDGPLNEIRNRYRTNSFRLAFAGQPDWNALPAGASLLSSEPNAARVQLNGSLTTNEFLAWMLPQAEIHGLTEDIPSVNDIFIQYVKSREA